jgi:hypothetical protein
MVIRKKNDIQYLSPMAVTQINKGNVAEIRGYV